METGGSVPVIVTMSGKLDLEDTKDLTADQVLAMIGQKWGIDARSNVDAFVVVHDQVLAKYRRVEGDQPIGEVAPPREVVRVVVPLKE